MVSRDPDEVRLLLERASWVERGVAEQRADAADGWRRASGVIDTLNAAIRADIDDTEE